MSRLHFDWVNCENSRTFFVSSLPLNDREKPATAFLSITFEERRGQVGDVGRALRLKRVTAIINKVKINCWCLRRTLAFEQSVINNHSGRILPVEFNGFWILCVNVMSLLVMTVGQPDPRRSFLPPLLTIAT